MITNLYGQVRPVKGMLNDTGEVILAEFKDSDYVDIINGGTGAGTTAGARANLKVVKFEYYTSEEYLPATPSEQNVIARAGTNMYYSVGDTWMSFGRMYISGGVIDGTTHTFADISELFFDPESGFTLEEGDNFKIKVKVDIRRNLMELDDVKSLELSQNQILIYDSASKQFVNKDFNEYAEFRQLKDVDLFGIEPDDKKFLKYDSTQQKVVGKDVQLSDLSDIDFSGALVDQILTKTEDGYKFVTRDQGVNLKNLEDLDSTGKVDQSLIAYDAETDRYYHVPQENIETFDQLQILKDVDITERSDGSLLAYNESLGKYVHIRQEEIYSFDELKKLKDVDLSIPDFSGQHLSLVYDQISKTFKLMERVATSGSLMFYESDGDRNDIETACGGLLFVSKDSTEHRIAMVG